MKDEVEDLAMLLDELLLLETELDEEAMEELWLLTEVPMDEAMDVELPMTGVLAVLVMDLLVPG